MREIKPSLGIRYAEAPRFAAPVLLEDWDVRGSFGPEAPQPERPIGLFVFGPPGATDEQCLYLNVWSPAEPGAARPVIVFVHGGGFTVGSGSAGISSGARLAAAADAVVVTLNYRLGSLGWLYHPELGGGNWGLQDQRAALEWVCANISAFGGDPARVTVMGQSAGALSIIDLLSAPGANDLFSRAIIQSPPMADAAHDPALGIRWAEALADVVGGFGALGKASADEVVAAHEHLLTTEAFRGTRGGALPMLDPATIPSPPGDAPGASPDVDVLLGTTANEGAFFFRAAGRNVDPDDDELRRIVGHMPGIDDAEAAIAAYGNGANAELLVRIATDAMVVVPAVAWGTARAAAGGRVHRYRVEHCAPQAGFGALHTIDVPLVFGTFEDDAIAESMCGGDAEARAVSAEMQRVVRDFVHGDELEWDAVGASASRGHGLGGDRAATDSQPVAVFGGIAPIRVEREAQPVLRS